MITHTESFSKLQSFESTGQKPFLNASKTILSYVLSSFHFLSLLSLLHLLFLKHLFIVCTILFFLSSYVSLFTSMLVSISLKWELGEEKVRLEPRLEPGWTWLVIGLLSEPDEPNWIWVQARMLDYSLNWTKTSSLILAGQ